ncbi:MAG: hypothetical protein JNM38_16895 [Acidobacteria bacterium]|nr:hypothetical protein [Acidobacteriota bacterium]
MVTRREVVTSGAIGALSTAALASPLATAAEAAQSASDADMVRALGLIDSRLQSVGRVLDAAVTQNSLAFGTVARIREQFAQYVRANFKFPDYCEIGVGVFYDLYDWHVKHGQELRFAQHQNRLTLRFMFTQLILRPEQDASFIGDPYDLTRPG